MSLATITQFARYRPSRLYKLVTKDITRTLSYVEKCRYIQSVKENSLECVQLIPQGKFLVYKGGQPLMKESTTGQNAQEMNWVSFPALAMHKPAVAQTSVFIGVDDEKTPLFGVQLGKVKKEEREALEESTGGVFSELRTSLFSVSWEEAHMLSRANALLMFNRNQAFCGHCGGATVRNATGDCRTCSKCNTPFYPYCNPVGIVLVTDPERENALLVRQPRHPPGMYTCIAGFADVGETLEDTVRREVAEEVGLEVGLVEYAASQHWPFPGVLMAGCYAVTTKLEPDIDENELENAQWLTRDQIGDAINTIKSNPFLRLGPDNHHPSPKSIFVPPQGTISHHLIYHWFKNTPIREIYSHIK